MTPAFPLHSAFLALPLGGQAKEEFGRMQDVLRAWFDRDHHDTPIEECLRFQNPQSPHLTLVFWKELLEIEYHQVLRSAASIAEKTEPFLLRFIGTETFGERGQDRVLFLTVEFSPELAILKKRCPWPQGQPFHPHVTLARISHAQRFAHEKKKIMKALDSAKDLRGFSTRTSEIFCAHIDRLRLYAEVDGKKQTPLQDFVFSYPLP